MIGPEIVRALDWLNRRSKAWACRIVQLTGQAPRPTHPKHLLSDGEAHAWYLNALRRDWVLVDVGCGTGQHTLRAANRVRFAVGIDRTVQNPAEMPANARFFAADLSARLPFPSGWVDAILCLDVIEHMDDCPALLREIWRVLKPSGLLFISAPNRDTAWRQRLRAAGLDSRSDPDHRVEFTKQEFVGMLYSAGFALADAPRPLVYDTPWAGLLDLAGACCPPFYRAQARWRRQQALRNPGESTGWAVVAARI